MLTPSAIMMIDRMGAEDSWVAAFHAGHHGAIERCYREECVTVLRALGRLLPAADAETVTHEVFHELLSNPALRLNFRGGNLGAWLMQVAKNAAMDHLRRSRREEAREYEGPSSADGRPESAAIDDEVEARMLIERFCRERLPPEWRNVFDARFLRHLSQRKAAEELGMRRTTLVYQEQRIRELLRTFLLNDESEGGT